VPPRDRLAILAVSVERRARGWLTRATATFPCVQIVSESSGLDERREIYFSGRVQGVGFRYTTRAIASRTDVRGYVRNLPDGRVLLVAEGAPATLDRFVRAVDDEMDRYIDSKQVTVGPASGEFARFEVRH
jgi:acylphosphatase